MFGEEIWLTRYFLTSCFPIFFLSPLPSVSQHSPNGDIIVSLAVGTHVWRCIKSNNKSTKYKLLYIKPYILLEKFLRYSKVYSYYLLTKNYPCTCFMLQNFSPLKNKAFDFIKSFLQIIKFYEIRLCIFIFKRNSVTGKCNIGQHFIWTNNFVRERK